MAATVHAQAARRLGFGSPDATTTDNPRPPAENRTASDQRRLELLEAEYVDLSRQLASGQLSNQQEALVHYRMGKIQKEKDQTEAATVAAERQKQKEREKRAREASARGASARRRGHRHIETLIKARAKLVQAKKVASEKLERNKTLRYDDPELPENKNHEQMVAKCTPPGAEDRSVSRQRRVRKGRHLRPAAGHTKGTAVPVQRRVQHAEAPCTSPTASDLQRDQEDAIDFVCLATDADSGSARAALEKRAWDIQLAAASLLVQSHDSTTEPARPRTPRQAACAPIISKRLAPCRPRPPDCAPSIPKRPDIPLEPTREALEEARERDALRRPPDAKTASTASMCVGLWETPKIEECKTLFHQFKRRPDQHIDRFTMTVQQPKIARVHETKTCATAERPRWKVSPRVPDKGTCPSRREAWEDKYESGSPARQVAAVHPGAAASCGLRLEELHAIADLLWTDPALPTEAMALAHAVQEFTGDGWVQSCESLRLTLRLAVFFAQHWDSFEAAKNSCSPADPHGVRSLRKKDFVRGYVSLINQHKANTGSCTSSEDAEPAAAEIAAAASTGFSSLPLTSTTRQPAAVSWTSYCRWVASRHVADAFLVSDTATRAAHYPPFDSLHWPIFSARETLSHFLADLGPVPSGTELKPWEHAVADRNGHSTMLEATRKWTKMLELRAKKAAEAREQLCESLMKVLGQEVKFTSTVATRLPEHDVRAQGEKSTFGRRPHVQFAITTSCNDNQSRSLAATIAPTGDTSAHEQAKREMACDTITVRGLLAGTCI